MMTQRHFPAFWTVMEQGIDGVCENMYQVTEVPAFLIGEAERALIKPDMCEGKKIFQLMRTRDITKCTERSLFIATRGHENCLVGGCNGANGKVGMTRFLGCGTDMTDFQLHAIVNEGEHQQNLLAFNTEKVMTGTRQVLALKEVRKTHTTLPTIVSPRVVEDLLFEYPKSISREERMQITSFKKQQDHFKSLAADPANHVFRPDGELAPMTPAIRTKIVEKPTHSITHDNEEKYWDNGTEDSWAAEMGGARDLMVKWANIPAEDIYGSRAPLLRLGGNRQFSALEQEGFVYDSSMVAPLSNP